MMTYDAVRYYVKKNHGVTVDTCHIADVKESLGLNRGRAHNRIGSGRVKPCPAQYRPLIVEAFRSNGDIA